MSQAKAVVHHGGGNLREQCLKENSKKRYRP